MPQQRFEVAVSVDLVLLTVMDGALAVALLKRDSRPHTAFAGELALPGGTIDTQADVDLEETLLRVMASKAGVRPPYFEQLQTFGDRHRDPRGWTLSVAYYALVPEGDIPPQSPLVLRPVDQVRSLPFDHKRILDSAVARVRNKAAYSSLPLVLLPDRFTLREMQTVYEHVLGVKHERMEFRRRVEALELVEPVAGQFSSGTGRPAQLYRRRTEGQRLVVAKAPLVPGGRDAAAAP